jgi:hypothetical protein
VATRRSATGRDPGLEAVEEELLKRSGPPGETFAGLIRQAIDEVLDGPRTGRFDFFDLEKTEKTYVGTKLEILLRVALEFERGPQRDLEVAGEPVDVKWSLRSAWMIPPESRGELALCVGGLKNLTEFQVGLVRCLPKHVRWPKTGSGQRDRKGGLTPAGRAAMRILVPATSLPPNFVFAMDAGLRKAAMDEPTIQRRVARLFTALPYTRIPRDALRTVAKTEGDPLRRSRQDAHAGDPVDGLIVLSNQSGGNTVLKALGRDPLAPGDFMAIKRSDLRSVPEPVRKAMKPGIRTRFGF